MSRNFIGQILLDQYRVEAFIASGGMGAVYRVWDLKRNVPLAMKVLHSDLAEDPHMFKRFKREANALKKLTHPNIVQFYGLFQTLDFAFLLEGFVDGPSLKDILRGRNGNPLPVQESLSYLKALSSALGYAHANGVVHCDVKPGNVLVDQVGNIYLTDFGIARHADSTTTTMVGAGTAAYMAPEQILGESVTPAADVYALGVMLFEMLTGQRPFRGNEAGTENGGVTANERIRYAHLHLDTPDPRSLNPSIPRELAQTIQKALEKDPALRYLSMQEFTNAVYAASSTAFSQVTDRIVLPSQFQETIQTVPPPLQQTPLSPPTANRKMLPWLIGGGALALIVLVFGFTGGGLQANSELTQAPEAVQEIASSSEDEISLATPKQLDTSSPRETKTPNPTPTPNFETITKTVVPTSVKNYIAEIAYVKNTQGSNIAIYIADSNGTNPRILVDNNCTNSEPDWSADGTSVIYQSNCRGSYDILHINTNGSIQEVLIGDQFFDEREPHYAHTEKKIAYVRRNKGESHNLNGDIRIYELNGNDRSTGLEGRGPVFSPDDSQLAYMAFDGKYWQIFLYNFSRQEIQQLTHTTHDCRWPNWSPDGRYIVYNSATGQGANPTGIWKILAKGGNPELVGANGNYGRPSWSDDNVIVFNGGNGLWVIRPDGTGLKQLTTDQGWAPIWSR